MKKSIITKIIVLIGFVVLIIFSFPITSFRIPESILLLISTFFLLLLYKGLTKKTKYSLYSIITILSVISIFSSYYSNKTMVFITNILSSILVVSVALAYILNNRRK